MVAFVTRKELDKVQNELKKLRIFLTDTFGAKFQDFMKEDEEPANQEDTGKEKDKDANTKSTPSISQSEPEIIAVEEIVRPERIPNRSEEDPLQVPATNQVTSVIDLTEIISSTVEKAANNLNMKKPDTSLNIACDEVAQRDHILKMRKIRWKAKPRTEEPRGIVPIQVSANVIPSRPRPLDTFKTKRSLALNDSTDTNKQQKTQHTNANNVASTSTFTSAPTPAPTENEIIQCEECQLFIFASQIENHKRNHALYDARKVEKTSSLLRKPYKCPVCQANCGNLDEYEEHVTESHPNLKGRPCPICSKVLSVKTRLRRHILIHDELKFCCNICGKGYNRSDNLIAHYKTHENNQEVSYFYCSICNNAFASRDGRDRHLKTAHQGQGQNLATASTSLNLSNTPLPLRTYSKSSQLGKQSEPESSSNSNPRENTNNGPICLVAAETERIKIDCDNLSDFEDEGDDD